MGGGCVKYGTDAPTRAPTKLPTSAPTNLPTSAPTKLPTSAPTMTLTNVPTKAPTATAPTGLCSALYGQCGGIDWVAQGGATCCAEGSSCEFQNDWYSQCL